MLLLLGGHDDGPLVDLVQPLTEDVVQPQEKVPVAAGHEQGVTLALAVIRAGGDVTGGSGAVQFALGAAADLCASQLLTAGAPLRGARLGLVRLVIGICGGGGETLSHAGGRERGRETVTGGRNPGTHVRARLSSSRAGVSNGAGLGVVTRRHNVTEARARNSQTAEGPTGPPEGPTGPPEGPYHNHPTGVTIIQQPTF